MDSVAEEWRAVVRWEGFYEVSNLGRVRSLEREVFRKDGGIRRMQGKVRATPIGNHGYHTITLSANGRRECTLLQIVVAEAWIGERPDGFHVDHDDFNRSNNRPSNLKYLSPQDNVKRTSDAGRTPFGVNHYAAILSENQIKEAFRLLDSGLSKRDAAAQAGIPAYQLRNVFYGKSWKHLGLARNQIAG